MSSSARLRGFTLIELLTVIAIIGILAGIIIPTVAGVKVSANNSKTKVQFSQWSTAIEQFRQENGFYPFFEGSNPPTDDNPINLGMSAVARQRFFEILNGRLVNGDALTDKSQGSALTQNKRRANYYTFGANEITTAGNTVSAFKDAFENQDIVLVIDYNYNGMIDKNKVNLAVRSGNDATGYGQTVTPDVPADDIRAGVIIYSAGRGDRTSDIVKSW